MITTKHSVMFIVIIFCYISTTSCARNISYYDVITYKNITDLFAEAKILTKDCENHLARGNPFFNQLSHLRLMSAQALEYEQRKSLNKNTIAQLRNINKSVLRLYDRYGKNKFVNNECIERPQNEKSNNENGCLRPTYCSSKMEVMSKKFIIALETETLKIKNNK